MAQSAGTPCSPSYGIPCSSLPQFTRHRSPDKLNKLYCLTIAHCS